MNTIINRAFVALALLSSIFSVSLWADDNSIAGTYKTLLVHEIETEEGTKYFHQFANITLRTVNPGNGELKISANLRIFFGDINSNEFLTYEFPDVPMNILTSQISLKTDESDVSLIGKLKNGKISGDWYASSIGRVGTFTAQKIEVPKAPEGSSLVKSVTGHYKGKIKNTNEESNLPERVTLSLVTIQEGAGSNMSLKISGNLRFYLGDFGSNEYVETNLEDVQFNFYNRYLTLRTQDYGVTFKGILGIDGKLDADVFADGFGKVGEAILEAKE